MLGQSQGPAPQNAGQAYLVGEQGPEMYVPQDGGRPEIIGGNGPDIMVPGKDGIVIPNQILRLALRLHLTLEQTLGLLQEMRGGGGGQGPMPTGGGPEGLPGAGRPMPPMQQGGGLRIEARADGGPVEGTENPLLRQRVSEFVQSALRDPKSGVDGLDEGMLRAAAARARSPWERASEVWNGSDNENASKSDEESGTASGSRSSSGLSLLQDTGRDTGLDPGVMAADRQATTPTQTSHTGGLQINSGGNGDTWGFQRESRPFSIPGQFRG